VASTRGSTGGTVCRAGQKEKIVFGSRRETKMGKTNNRKKKTSGWKGFSTLKGDAGTRKTGTEGSERERVKVRNLI